MRKTSVAFIVLSLLTAACSMKSQEPPPLTGPSGTAISIGLTVTPDVLTQDGASQSLVVVNVRDANGQPARGLSLRAETAVGGTVVDFGSLSARNIVTGNDGRATTVYTAPPGPTGPTSNPGTVVTLVITPIGNNFTNSTPSFATILLVPQGSVIPPDGLQPRFVFTPPSPADHEPVLLDATTSQSPANNPITRFRWTFGDGDSADGITAVHSYDDPGMYVITLTVFDAYNRSASTSQSISVGAGVGPTASFTSSPTEPLPGQQVNFNAATSTAAPGRRIVKWVWDFGDGSPAASGVQASHTYTVLGTYVVTLTVTDDVGRTATVSRDIPVGVVDDDDGGGS